MAGVIWAVLMAASLLYAIATGNAEQTGKAVIDGAGKAVETALALAGACGFFSGIMELLKRAGALASMRKMLLKILSPLFPGAPEEAMDSIALNMSANMLGLGNAATPAGFEAMRQLPRNGNSASDAMCMLIVINASSIQIVPTTIIALRSAAGSASPSSVFLPILISTAVSTVTAIILALICARVFRRREG